MLKLKKINKPEKGSSNKDINWFCKSLCLISGRDIDSNSNKIITRILKTVSKHEKVYSEELARDLDLKLGLINYHIRNLIDSGILIRKNKQIFLRGGSLKEAIKEIRENSLSILEDIEIIAEEIDSSFGINNR